MAEIDFIGLIGSLGFPIAACIWMAYFQQTILKELTDTNQQLTTAIEKLISKMGGTE